MRKILVANRKGGTAKTTTAVHLAHALALAEYDVLLIDGDTQGHCAAMLGVEPDTGLAEYIEHGEESAIVEARARLHILAGGPSLAGVGRLIARQDMDGHLVLSNALAKLDGYDFAIIDSNPSYSPFNVNVLFYATELMIPVSMTALSIGGMADLMAELEPVRQRAQLDVDYIVPTMFDGRPGHHKATLPTLRERYGDTVTNEIRYVAEMERLPARGETIFEVDLRSRAARDYMRLMQAVVNHG